MREEHLQKFNPHISNVKWTGVENGPLYDEIIWTVAWTGSDKKTNPAKNNKWLEITENCDRPRHVRYTLWEEIEDDEEVERKMQLEVKV